MKNFYLKTFVAVAAFMLLSHSLLAKQNNKLVIYQTSDIHSQLFGDHSGWLNLAQTIRNHRKKLGIGSENSLLIDCGDTIPGTIIGSLSKGRAALAILNTLKYDAWIIGNHDLEFEFNNLQKISRDSKVDILAANLKPNTKGKFLNWKLYKKGGIKAAVIGMTSPYIDEWLWGKKKVGYTILPTIKTIEKLMPEILKKTPDIIILVIHHGRFSPKRLKGFNIDKIAERFPQIDLIMGGHTHQEVPGEKCGRSTWYVEAGCHAKKFGFIEITVDKDNHKVDEIKSRLIPVEENNKINLDLKKSINKWTDKAKLFSSQTLGKTKNIISPNAGKELFGSMNELFCKAISSATGANIAFHGSVVKSVKFEVKITEQDVFDAIPYEDSVCTLELNQKELKTIIKEQLKKSDKGRFQSPFGIKIFIDKSNKIALTDENGQKLQDGKKYLSAFSSYVLAGAGGRFPELKKIAMLKTSKGLDTGITIRDALREYIKQNSPLDIKVINRLHYKNQK